MPLLLVLQIGDGGEVEDLCPDGEPEGSRRVGEISSAGGAFQLDLVEAAAGPPDHEGAVRVVPALAGPAAGPVAVRWLWVPGSASKQWLLLTRPSGLHLTSITAQLRPWLAYCSSTTAFLNGQKWLDPGPAVTHPRKTTVHWSVAGEVRSSNSRDRTPAIMREDITHLLFAGWPRRGMDRLRPLPAVLAWPGRFLAVRAAEAVGQLDAS
jgi:hypothetical protein